MNQPKMTALSFHTYEIHAYEAVGEALLKEKRNL